MKMTLKMFMAAAALILLASSMAIGDDVSVEWQVLTQRARDYRQQGHVDKAIELTRRAAEIALAGKGSEHPAYLRSQHDLAYLYMLQGRSDDASSLVKGVLAACERHHAVQTNLAVSSLILLGDIALEGGDTKQAEVYFKRACDVCTPYNRLNETLVISAVTRLARIYGKSDRARQSEALYRRALELARRCYAADHPETGMLFAELAGLLYGHGKDASALELDEQSLRITEKNLGPANPVVDKIAERMVVAYLRTEQLDKALVMMRRSVQILSDFGGKDNPKLIAGYVRIARLLIKKGDYDQAERAFGQAFEAAECLYGRTSRSAAEARRIAGVYFYQAGQYDKAERLFNAAIERFKAVGDQTSFEYGCALGNLAEIYRLQGDYPRAEALFKQALAIQADTRGALSPELEPTIMAMAQLYNAMRKHEKALSLWQCLLTASERRNGPEHPLTLNRMDHLAGAYCFLGRYDMAEALLVRCVAVCEKDPARGASLIFMLSEMAELYRMARQPDKLAAVEARLKGLRQQAAAPESASQTRPAP